MVSEVVESGLLSTLFFFQKLFMHVLSITLNSKVKKMRKATAILLGFILTTAVSIAVTRPAKADIETFTWLPPYILKDYVGAPYWDDVVVYKDGETVSLLVSVENTDYPTKTLNVSKVIINFYDMGKNKTLDYSASPHAIAHNFVEYFTVSFTANLTEAGSASLDHEYRIYVEHVNATTGPKQIVGTYELYWSSVYPGYKYVVWSTSQATAGDLMTEYNYYESNYPWWQFDSIEGEHLAFQATIHGDMGETAYEREDYASAQTHYQTALDLYADALAAEQSWTQTDQNAKLNVTLTEAAAAMTEANADMKLAEAAQTEANAAVIEANATKLQAEAALTNAYGWYFIGIGFAIGWSFMGIGVIIYALKRPKPPA